jgi:hypothetical protein
MSKSVHARISARLAEAGGEEDMDVANLALVRATGWVQEFAIRGALGSSRTRLARQLMLESLILAGLGGIARVARRASLVAPNIAMQPGD